MAESAQVASHLLDVAAFRAFLEARPSDERWELIEGNPVQSAAPRIAHQRIASNVERHLNAVLRRVRPLWRADRAIGIEVTSTSRYRPEPEVTVIDAVIDTEPTYTEQFHLVLEVPSASDRVRIRESKLSFYTAHPHNGFIVIAEQDRIAVTVHQRQEDGSWTVTTLTEPGCHLVLGELGPIYRIADIYADTHPDPDRWS